MPADRMRYRAAEVVWREVGADVVILDLTSSRYLSLNASGAVLWRAVADGATKDELVDVLLARFDVDRDVAVRDVEAFLATGANHGLIVHDD